MTTNSAEYAAEPPERGSVSIDELARRKHVRPIRSADSDDVDERLPPGSDPSAD